jgi:hypothetical protein
MRTIIVHIWTYSNKNSEKTLVFKEKEVYDENI